MKVIVRFGALLLGVLFVSACVVVGPVSGYPSTKIKYKMIVEVDTPEGIKTGYAVRQIAMTSRPMFLGESNDTHVRLEKGEAVAVDLGSRGVLFATLSGASDPMWGFFKAFPTPCLEGPVSRCSVKYYADLKVDYKALLRVSDYPMIVAFDDINDPKTARKVLEMKSCTDPAERLPQDGRCIAQDHSEEIFGQGVKIKAITIELTDAKIKQKMHQILPWLDAYYSQRLDGQRYEFANAQYRVANSLSSGSFSAGFQ